MKISKRSGLSALIPLALMTVIACGGGSQSKSEKPAELKSEKSAKPTAEEKNKKVDPREISLPAGVLGIRTNNRTLVHSNKKIAPIEDVWRMSLSKTRIAYTDGQDLLHVLDADGQPLPGFTPVKVVLDFFAVSDQLIAFGSGTTKNRLLNLLDSSGHVLPGFPVQKYYKFGLSPGLLTVQWNPSSLVVYDSTGKDTGVIGVGDFDVFSMYSIFHDTIAFHPRPSNPTQFQVIQSNLAMNLIAGGEDSRYMCHSSNAIANMHYHTNLLKISDSNGNFLKALPDVETHHFRVSNTLIAYLDKYATLFLLDTQGNPIPGFTPVPEVSKFEVSDQLLAYTTKKNEFHVINQQGKPVDQYTPIAGVSDFVLADQGCNPNNIGH